MSRARKNGILVSLLIAGGLLAGCGGSSAGTTASQAAPTGSEATAPATPAEPTPDPSNGVIQAIPEENPTDARFKNYDRFPLSGSSWIFVPPDAYQDAVAAAAAPDPALTPTDPAAGGGTVDNPSAGTTVPPTTTSTTNSGATFYLAQAEVNGTSQPLQVGSQVPAQNSQFTVSAISANKVTLRLNSGTFPGGSNTIDIASGSSVTLSNPTSAATVFVLVKAIAPVPG